MTFAISFFISLFSSWLLMPSLIRNSAKWKLMDNPTDGRKQHSRAISRAGGIGIVLGSFLAILIIAIDLATHARLLAAGLIIVVFGLIDDVRNLGHRWKLVGQVAAVVLAMSGGVMVDNVPLISSDSCPTWVAYGFTFLMLLGITNAVNLTDGMDGLAGGSTLMSLGLIAVLSYLAQNYGVALIAIAIMGGISGFLRYNTHPAEVFMGDTGSQFIGFMAACLAILCTQDPATSYSPALPLLIMGLPILDTLYVILIRFLNGKSIFTADRSHLHHRLARLNFADREAVALVYLAQTILMALAYTLRHHNDLVIIGSYTVFCSIILMLLIAAKRMGWNHQCPHEKHLSNYPDIDKRNPLFRGVGQHYTLLRTLLALIVTGTLAISVAVLWLGSQGSVSGPTSVGLSIILALVLAVAIVRGNLSVNFLRFITGIAIAVLLYAASQAAGGGYLRYLLDGYLLLVVIALFICVRVTRYYRELLNTQDFLILCVLVILPVLPIERTEVYLLFRITLMLYAIEFLISIGSTNRRLLAGSSVASLFFGGLVLLV